MPPSVTSASPPVDKSGDRVRRMFGQIASRYDFLNHLLSLNIDRYWRWRTVRLVPPNGDRPILDVCTGTGDLALAYHKVAQPSVSILGIDFCPEMLAIAKQKSLRAGADAQIELVEADAQHLPLEDDLVQIVAVAFGLRNVADTDRGLREMMRVCAPGGRVAVLEFSTPRWQPLKAIYTSYFRHILPRVGQWVAGNSEGAYHYLPSSVGEFPQYDELVEKMEVAGLTNVQFYPLTFGVATLYVGEKPTTGGS